MLEIPTSWASRLEVGFIYYQKNIDPDLESFLQNVKVFQFFKIMYPISIEKYKNKLWCVKWKMK